MKKITQSIAIILFILVAGTMKSQVCSGIPATPLVLSSASAVCPSVTVNFSVSNPYTDTGISYQWLSSTTSSSSGFATIPGATTAVLSNTNLTTTTWYQLQVTCANGGGVAASAPNQVMLGAPTLTSVASSTAFCRGLAINLSLTPATTGVTYQWLASSTSSSSGFASIGGANLSTLSTTVGALGNNWYETVVTCSANTSFSATSIPAQVLQKATPTASATASSNTVCYNSAFNLNGGTDLGTLFSWTGPNSYTSNAQNPTGLTYTNGGSATYAFVATLNGCSSAASNITINAMGLYGGGVASITPTTVCAGNTATLQLTAFTSNVNNYSFLPSTGTALLPLTSGSSTLVTGAVDDAPSGLSAIGFPFIYNGTSYTQISVSPDGWMRFGSIGADEYSNSVTSSSNLPKLYPYWDDVHTGTSGYVRTQALGSAPSRTMVIEWFVTIPRSGSAAANSRFQAWLIEGSNTIQFVYGTMGSGSMSASIGLTGSNSNYNSVTISNNTNSTSSPNDNNSGQPASGTSYLFTPPVAPTYTWAPGALLSSTSGATVTSTPTIAAGTFTALNNYSLNVQYQGCLTTKTLNALVANNPTLTLSITNTNICSGASATVTASGANTYTWSTTANTSSIVVSPAVNTSYTVSARNGSCSIASQVISLTVSQNPTVTISGSPGICAGQNATLTANGASTYLWDSGSTATAIVDSPGANTGYTVTGTDALGCKGTATQTVTVAPAVNISIAGPSTICPGQAVNLTASGGVTYTWSTGETTSAISPSPTSTTTYSVIGASGICSNSAITTVSVNPNPTITVTALNNTVCAGTTITLTATGGNTYTWSTSSTASAVAVTPTNATNPYTVTGASVIGCITSTIITITTNTVPVIAIAESPTQSVCPGNSATLTASGATTYTWNTGANTPVINPVVSIPTTYTVIGANTAGCLSGSVMASVGINATPTLNTLGSSSGICTGQTATLIATSDPASPATSYLWSTGATTPSLTVQPVNTTTYTVTGTNALGCTSSATQVINVAPSLTIAITGSAGACVGQTIGLAATGGVTYTWSTGATTSGIAPTFTGTTTYSVIGASGTCSNSASKTVTVNPVPVLAVTGNSTICAGQSTTLTVGAANTYSWSTGITTATIALAPTTNTTYTVTGTSSLGCVTTITTAIVSNSLPVIAVAQSATAACIGTSVTYTASGANTYTWTGGPQTAIYSVVPAAASNAYTVSGSNTTGCVGSKTVSAVGYTIPVLSVTPASATVCTQYPTSFTVTALSPATTFSWSNASTSSVVLVAPSNNPTYTVTGTNPAGCSTSATVAVTTLSLPVISVAPSQATVCANSATTFTANGAATYTWDNTGTVTGSTTVLSPANPVTNYSLAGTSVNGCVNTVQFTVFTYSLPVISVSASAGTVCAGSPATFTASGANTYSWTGGPVNAQYTVNPSGSTTVYSVSGTNILTGCVGTQTISVGTTPLPVVTITTASTTVCGGTSIILTGGGAASYVWSDASVNNSISATPGITTTYSVTGTDTDGCTNTAAVTVNVNALPTVVVTPATTTVCAEGSVILTASGATSYSWIPGNTASVSIVSTPTITASNYTVIGTDANGCVSEGTASVYLDACTGIKTSVFADNLISVYPNPSTGAFTAKFDFEGKKTVTIVNSIGQLITQATTTNTAETFNLSGAAKGIYFVKVSTKEASGNYKIVIE